MVKKRQNSKKSHRINQPPGSTKAKTPPFSDGSRPTSRLSNPSDVENAGHADVPSKTKCNAQKPQVFGNKSSQLNIAAKPRSNGAHSISPEPNVSERCVDSLPVSSISSSRLDDTDVHIREMISEFRDEIGEETTRLKAIADINYMIGSTSSFFQRFTIRKKLHSYGFLSALAAHADRSPQSKAIDEEVNMYLQSESRDARIMGLHDDNSQPIEILTRILSKTSDQQWENFVSLWKIE